MRIKTYTGARRVGTGRVSRSSLPVRPLWFQIYFFRLGLGVRGAGNLIRKPSGPLDRLETRLIMAAVVSVNEPPDESAGSNETLTIVSVTKG